MPKRKIVKTPEQEMEFGVTCRYCGNGKAMYEDSYTALEFITWRFRCRKCGEINIRVYPKSKVKEITPNATNG